MTLADTPSFPEQTSGTFATVGKIAKIAFPLMVGSLAAAGLQIVKAGLLSYTGQEADLYLLSMVTPAFIFMLAFLESLAITNQVFSSKSVNNWAKGDVFAATKIFSIMGAVLTCIVAAGFYGTSFFIGGLWAEGPQILPQMSLFVLSLLPFLLFEMRNGALRGQGRTGLALLPFVVLIVTDIAVTWVAVSTFGLGFHGVLIGNIAGPLVAMPLAFYLLRREIGDAERGAPEKFKKHMIGLTIGVAGPVFASMFAGSASAAVIFPALANLGQDIASGFLLIVRIRIMFIIPAIAVGSAIAILVNQMPEQGQGAEKRNILITGILSVLVVYGFATLGIDALRGEMVGFVVGPENAILHSTTAGLMRALAVTFFFIAAFTMVQVILEHLGHGVFVLLVTIVFELATIGLTLFVAARGYDVSAYVTVMNVTAVASFLVLAVVLANFIRKLERSDAV